MQDHPRALRRHIAAALAIPFVLFTGAAVAQEEKLPAGAKVVRIEATPPAVTLKNPFDYAQVILTFPPRWPVGQRGGESGRTERQISGQFCP